MSDRLALLTRYYAACSAGDLEGLTSTLHPDVVHYFLAPNAGSKPVAGGAHLAHYWRKVAQMIRARWVIDHYLGDDDEAVIEWSMFWNPGGTGARVATRGAEWFRFSDDRISEIRSYYQQTDGDSQLDAFDYVARGYSTHGDETSRVHDDVLSGSIYPLGDTA
jgi:ketosteroid isomerase-like protein